MSAEVCSEQAALRCSFNGSSYLMMATASVYTSGEVESKKNPRFFIKIPVSNMPNSLGSLNNLNISPPMYEAANRMMRVSSLPPGTTSVGMRV